MSKKKQLTIDELLKKTKTPTLIQILDAKDYRKRCILESRALFDRLEQDSFVQELGIILTTNAPAIKNHMKEIENFINFGIIRIHHAATQKQNLKKFFKKEIINQPKNVQNLWIKFIKLQLDKYPSKTFDSIKILEKKFEKLIGHLDSKCIYEFLIYFISCDDDYGLQKSIHEFLYRQRIVEKLIQTMKKNNTKSQNKNYHFDGDFIHCIDLILLIIEREKNQKASILLKSLQKKIGIFLDFYPNLSSNNKVTLLKMIISLTDSFQKKSKSTSKSIQKILNEYFRPLVLEFQKKKKKSKEKKRKNKNEKVEKKDKDNDNETTSEKDTDNENQNKKKKEIEEEEEEEEESNLRNEKEIEIVTEEKLLETDPNNDIYECFFSLNDCSIIQNCYLKLFKSVDSSTLTKYFLSHYKKYKSNLKETDEQQSFVNIYINEINSIIGKGGQRIISKEIENIKNDLNLIAFRENLKKRGDYF
ncbi:squamous cell carcinoma antigen recognized by cytotoxic t lymphocytes [Anaeramoeba flamelloides]|uniref:Squamous cell carcinoma antigen recognized by cytotoxic t lymphocytes n=1 Tax=Anaeramoeba flamelloides TaxID=1746091 RepID=A0AAV7Z6Q0_9EUKA|nr:squamous cell carcinoma antigen recognized by cytotoxic t lymphocytes [Anaeramoeba flamelloides]